jgi:hypothetical protein
MALETITTDDGCSNGISFLESNSFQFDVSEHQSGFTQAVRDQVFDFSDVRLGVLIDSVEPVRVVAANVLGNPTGLHDFCLLFFREMRDTAEVFLPVGVGDGGVGVVVLK